MFWQKVRKNGPWCKNDKKSNSNSWKNKRRDKKGESDESPKILDRGLTSDISSHHSGWK